MNEHHKHVNKPATWISCRCSIPNEKLSSFEEELHNAPGTGQVKIVLRNPSTTMTELLLDTNHPRFRVTGLVEAVGGKVLR